MTDETLIFKLLAHALLDIRIAGFEGNSKAAFHMADLFHSVPYQIARIQGGNGNYREVLDWLEMRCKQKGMEPWLRTAISNASQGEVGGFLRWRHSGQNRTPVAVVAESGHQPISLATHEACCA